MLKHIAVIVVLLVGMVLPSHAVLKEKDIASTLAILRQELTNYHSELERQTGYMKEQQAQVTSEIISVFQRSQQNALMLYSQRNGNIFDLTYACHEATEQYRKFRVTAAPFREYIDNANIEVVRYDSLISDLSTMYTEVLTPQAKTDRNVCLTLAINIRRTLQGNRAQIEQYVQMYEFTENHLKRLNDYAEKRYGDIQNSIFSNGGDTYLAILRRLGTEVRETATTVKQKYMPLKHVKSDWDSTIIVGLLIVLVVGIMAAAVLNYFFVGFLFTWLVRTNRLNAIFNWVLRKKDGIDLATAFQAKRLCIIMATTVITFAIILGIVRLVWEQNFIIMACGLLVEYAWLMGVVLFSLLIRLDGSRIRSGFLVYLPIMAICLVVISFRIILIPNNLVTLIFPPVLLLCAVWQWRVAARHLKALPKRDVIYTYISLAVFLASIVASVVGYTLLAVEMLIWWTMQMTCILTITCLSSLMQNYGNHPKRRYFEEQTPITRTWLFRLIYNVAVPTMGALSILVSIYWAADIFNLSATTREVFNMHLIDTQNFTLSLYAVVGVIILFYIFRFLNSTITNFVQYNFWLNEQERAKEEDREANYESVVSRIAMWRNVIQVLVWGAWALIAMNIFHINNSWIVAISAGLSTGVGFAMKDILENIYYGVSLMAGRIKVGDYISIDDTRGTVKNVSYVSTMIEAYDGSIISFQNSQLFTKNYKNLTKNHGNELSILMVGVAYGSDTAEVRKIIGDAVRSINHPGYIRYVNTVMSGLGDSSVDFKVMVWVDSRRRSTANGDILEAIYNALNQNHIEIPFPQRDLHIVSDDTKNVPVATGLDGTPTPENYDNDEQ